MERLLRLAHDQPDERVVDQVRDRQRPDADAVSREVGGDVREDSRPVLEKHRELRLRPHRRNLHERPSSGRAFALQPRCRRFGLAPRPADGYR